MANRVRQGAGSLILVLAVFHARAAVWAQAGPAPAAALVASSGAPAAAPAVTAAAATNAAAASVEEPSAVRLMVGRSAVVNVGTSITRVSLTSPDIADAMVTGPGQLLIHGKLPGTISMFVWDKGGALTRYEVVVQRDLVRLSEQMRELFPNETINVQSNGRNVVLSGQVTSKDVIEKAVNVAAGYVDKKEEVVALLQLQGNAPTNQVLLRVRFAEVSRSALTELGASVFTTPLGVENTLGRVTTEQFPAPNFQDLQSTKVGENWQEFGHKVDSAGGKLNFSDFLNFFLYSERYDLGLAIRAMQSKGLFQSLAEPNLVAESGKDASFLAGGEFPIPVVQGSGANLAINVVFKEFGIRLNFTPTVNGDRIHLKVRPEVSTLDFNNAVTLQGFRIPALSTRRTETELELRNHQTFAIAGLMNNSVASTLSKIPGIGDIPILGYLFKSKAAQKQQTELVVMITPEILANGSPGVTPTLPRGSESFLPPIPEKKLAPPQPEAFQEERRTATPAPTVAEERPAPSAPVSQPTSALTALSALTTASSVRMAEPGEVKVADVPPPAVADKPLSDSEKKALERAKKDDEERERERDKVRMKAEARAKAEEEKRVAAEADAERRAAELEKQREEKAAREQARQEAESKKRAEEEARRELARQRERQQAIDAAAAQLKAAQDRYDAEVSKTGKP